MKLLPDLRSPSVRILFASAVFTAGCGSGTSNDGAGSEDNVTVLVPRATILAVTGSSDLEVSALFETLGGPILLVDGVSGSVLSILNDGSAGLFVPRDALTDVTGKASVLLGAFDQVRQGTLAGLLLVADSTSGELLRIDAMGTPSLFTTRAQVLSVTQLATANLSLPRDLTINQIIAQDLVSGSLLRFDPAGNATMFVEADDLAGASGLTVAQSAVAGWTRGPVSGNLFARFIGTSNIVRLTLNGTVSRHVISGTLATLFPDVTDLRVLEIVAATDSDALLVLIGEGPRGVAVAHISSNGVQVAPFTTKSAMRTAAGDAVDISDLVVLPSGIPAAVDRGGAKVLTFNDAGQPFVVGRRQDIVEASGSENPALSISAGLPNGTALVPEGQSDTLLRVK